MIHQKIIFHDSNILWWSCKINTVPVHLVLGDLADETARYTCEKRVRPSISVNKKSNLRRERVQLELVRDITELT